MFVLRADVAFLLLAALVLLVLHVRFGYGNRRVITINKKKRSFIKKKKIRHLLYYVEDCTPIAKEFDTIEEMDNFIGEFLIKHPDPMDGYFINFKITNVHGDIIHFE